MRVIAGEARGKRLMTLETEEITRPTIERVKEGMFSSIQFILPGAHVLDLFAGSGQLGIEALSRGAKRCVFLDQNRQAIDIIMQNCKNCGVFDRSRVSPGEALMFLRNSTEEFDIIFLDPPFASGLLEEVLPLLSKNLASDGVVLCETPKHTKLPEQIGELTLKKQYKYGTVLVWKYIKEDLT